DQELIAPGETFFGADVQALVLVLRYRRAVQDPAPTGDGTNAARRGVIEVEGPVIAEGVGEDAVQMDRELSRDRARVTAGDLLRVGVGVVTREYGDRGRRGGTELQRTQAAVWVGIRWP